MTDNESMTARPGTPDATTTPPTPHRHVTPNGHALITLNLNPTDLLTLLARAIVADDALSAEWEVLGRSGTSRRRATSLNALLASQNVRDALTLTLTQTDAQTFAFEVEDAAQDLPCQEWTERCDGQAESPEHLICPDHTAAHAKVAEYQAKVRRLRAQL